MHIFPVAMSLVASYVSAVTVIGTPTDIYYYGSQYWMIIISVILMGFVVSYVYLPVFQTLRLNSSYQYLELRFNFILRSMASFMFVMDEVCLSFRFIQKIYFKIWYFRCYFCQWSSLFLQLPSIRSQGSVPLRLARFLCVFASFIRFW